MGYKYWRGLWVAKCSTSIVFSASVDNELVRNPPLLICPSLGPILEAHRFWFLQFESYIQEEETSKRKKDPQKWCNGH